MAISIGLGAFAAHGLKSVLDEYRLSIFETGVDYQMIHSLGLILIVAFRDRLLVKSFHISAIAFLVGILCFSGSLYGLAMTDFSWLDPITPLGGVSFIIGWMSFGLGLIFQKRHS